MTSNREPEPDRTAQDDGPPRKGRWAKRSALVVVAVLLALILAEGFCRLRGFRTFPRRTDRTQFWRFDPELGWAHRPGQDDWFEMPDFRTRVTINGKGLRDEEHPYARTGIRKRMLVLGDSFVWGYGVEQADRFTEGIERAADVEVINAGVSGYATDQELLWYRTEGVRYDVDHVLLVLCADDHAQNNMDRVFSVYGKPRFVPDGESLTLTNVPVPAPPATARIAHWLRCRSALFNLLTLGGAPRAPRGATADDFPPTHALLREMRDLAASKGAGFSILLAARRWWGGPDDQPVEAFVTALRSDGFRVLDIEYAPGFDSDGMVMPGNGHWNEAGHEFVAKMLLRHGGLDHIVSRSR